MQKSEKIRIFQIYYDKPSLDALDSGFIPLNNSSNERPDWYEYWPIRNFLKSESLQEDCYYGFLSPKFKQKTNLSSADVHKFASNSDADIILFSPYFDHIAFYFNSFEQAHLTHGKDFYELCAETLKHLGIDFAINKIPMNSTNTIYCNYFLAKPKIWQQWLNICEKIFDLCESNDSDLAKRLNASITHNNKKNSAAKIFLIERILSIILSTNKSIKTQTHNPIHGKLANPKLHNFRGELILMDALKISYEKTGWVEYMQIYDGVKKGLLGKFSK